MEQGRGTVGEVARAFLRLGVTAFGGPAAHIALINREFVDERAWISREEFLDAVSAANIIPGPNSTEVAMHIGHRRAGALGLIAAGVGFILPAALLVTAIAAWYVRGAQLPAAARALAAVQPVVLVILVQALGTFATTALRTRTLSVIAVLSVLLAMAGVPELLVLAVGAVAALSAVMARRDTVRSAAIVGAGGLQALSLQGATTGATATIGLLPLFLSFLKIGSVLFGSGYVLLVFLRAEFVDRLHWITTGQLLDAVAVGQLTPGPLFTAATFIGYLVAGGRGATVATIGIFLPAFLLVALSARLLPIVRRHAGFSAALDGINAASLALMSTVAVHLGITALATPMQWGIGVVSAALVFRWRAPTWALVTGAALLGLSVA